jgi:arylsulfatase A-like enzyme
VPPTPGKKPNIVLIVSDDTGYGDFGPYGGGVGRGMPTPNFDRIADEGMTFFHCYGQASCTPGRAALATGRHPNRSGMTTVAFPGQGGGLPAAEWTSASLLKQAGYQTFYTGKWHLGEADYALPIAHGYDEMEHVGLYHLNVFTYGDPAYFPDMDPKLRALYQKVTKGLLSGKAGETAHEDFKVSGELDTPEKGVVGIKFLDAYIEKSATDYLERAYAPDKPFFAHINFMKNHQPNIPHPDYVHKSNSKSPYADSVVELDARVGHVMDKIRELDKDGNTFVFYTVDNGAWQDVFPDSGYTPFRGTKGTDREGGLRVPGFAWWPGKIKANSKNHDIVGGIDLLATYCSLAGLPLPDKDREGQPTIFDSYDIAPVLFGTGPCPRNEWFYFTENELLPGAVRLGNYKFVFNMRGDDGAHTGGLSVDSNYGWKGADKYVATVPQIFDLWSDPQERYDLFMNNFTERTWLGPVMGDVLEKIGKTYMQYPPRKLQSDGYSGPLTITQYQRFAHIREQLTKEGIKITLPSG